MTPTVDVVGVGTNSVDRVLALPAALDAIAESGKARMQARHLFCGGQTATAICACGAFALSTRYVGVFGTDENGRVMRRTLEDRGIDVAHAIESKGPNRDAVILVDPDGRRTVIWHRPNHLDFPSDRLRPEALNARVMHIDDDDPRLALAAARLALTLRIPVTTDLEHVTDTTEELIATVTYPIFEQHAPCRLTGESDPERGLRKLRHLTPNLLCMTLGDKGAVALEGDRFHVAPAFKVNVVDTTGAGDVFRAAFIYGLLHRWGVPQQLRFANAAAAISCTRLGAIPSVPTLDEVQSLLQ